ncbi:MAG: glycosyltransferase [Actinomycetia bacterium]|nr:glycosyltransferase [Actinomycetes bacterium]MCP4224951.1 glycosyltransferase [Actinomycetes bacterium]
MASSPIDAVVGDDDRLAASIGARQTTILIASTDPDRGSELAAIVEAAGWLALMANDDDHAVSLFREAPPDLVLLAFQGTAMAELGLLDRLRKEPDGDRVPIVCNPPRRRHQFVVEAFGRRADDVIAGRPHPAELTARLRVRMERRPLPRQELLEDPITGALTQAAFSEQVDRELERVHRGGRQGALGFLALEELPELETEYGSRARDEIVSQVVHLIKEDSRTLDFVGFSMGVVGLLMPGTGRQGAQIRLDRLSKLIYRHPFTLGGDEVQITPIIGYTESIPDVTADDLASRAWAALSVQAEQRDLHPTRWKVAMSEPSPTRSRFMRSLDRIRTPIQVTLQQTLLLGAPFMVYLALGAAGVDVTQVMYLVVLFALLVTSAAVAAESNAAKESPEPPLAPDVEPPLASAVIAAYLPNEADTIIETIEAFLTQDYPNLQIILAYNTPQPLDVEQEIEAIAIRDPRFEPIRVEGSVSKAQNVNAAVSRVRGEFVGVFDADHHPAPGSFERAWRWINSGVGVVQGHCVIRNGETNFVTRLVAAEFEVIYAVSHPGRARLHGFGVFGGSNGYWRTSLLQSTRMRGFMLTEDIDSTMRVLQSGETIVSDRDLVSTELAPESASALWNQRLRWAQGWSQVSLRHIAAAMGAAPNARQRFGMAYLLGWRELYPWISLQMLPLLAYWWIRNDGVIDWFVPIFVITSLATFMAGPVQVWYGWRLSHESIGQHRRWFWLLLISSLVFYTEIKNVVSRTAHIKEVMRDRQWKVTPRSSGPSVDAEADAEALAVAGALAVDDEAPEVAELRATSGEPLTVVDSLASFATKFSAGAIGSEAEADERAKRSTPHDRRSTDPVPGEAGSTKADQTTSRIR